MYCRFLSRLIITRKKMDHSPRLHVNHRDAAVFVAVGCTHHTAHNFEEPLLTSWDQSRVFFSVYIYIYTIY